jgi:RNA polymerase sigma factor (sigma-70 family)
MTRIIRSIASNLLPRLSTGEVLVLDDAAALDRYAKAGDPRAFEVLVHRYQSMVVHTCQRVMKSSTDAEDAAQETFLKLARRAGEIRSNVAAWLHACALRTSIDLLRARGTQRRAEAGVVDVDAQTSDDAERTWREIKPLLDDAIAALDESDRDLVVSRFLVGRPQVEMAREAGVNPGTMHRRIDAALEKLRKELTKRGVAPAIGLGATGAVGAVGTVGAVGAAAGATGLGNSALASALTHASAGPVSASLTSSLMSVGLAEMGAGAAIASTGSVATSATIGLNLGTFALASILGLGAIGGGLYLFNHGAPPMLAGLAVAPEAFKPGGFERPKNQTTPARLVSETTSQKPDGRFSHEGDMLRAGFGKADGSQEDGVEMKILSVTGDKSPDASGRAKGNIRVRFEHVQMRLDAMKDQLLHNERDASYEVDGDLLTFTVRLDVKVPPPPPGEQQTTWIPEEARIVVVRKKGPDPKDPPSTIPALAGSWQFINDCDLRMDSDNLVISWTQGDGSAFPAVKLRVLEWTNAGDSSKVQTIVTAHAMDPAMVGKRLKLLARRDARGWTIVWNDPATKKLNEWPTGFEGKPGEIVRFSFQEAAK